MDVALGDAANLSVLARELGVTRYTVRRHREKHVSPRGVVIERMSSPEEGEADEETRENPQKPQPKRHHVVDPPTAFLTSFSANGDLKAALKAAGVNRVQLRKWQEHEPDFALRYRQAEAEAVETLESEARIRAVAGSKSVRKVYRHGLLYEEVHTWSPSDAMLTKLLQAHRPEKYGDRLTLTQTTVVKAVDADAWNSV